MRIIHADYRPSAAQRRAGVPRSLTIETWRLSCPRGHVWEATRER